MAGDRAALAAVNNAVWCDAVCRARGGATAWGDGLWHHAGTSPPYFPSAVTLSPAATNAQVLQALQGRGGEDVVGVKDSFCQLDLGGAGFERLFEARWLWHEPAAGAQPEARLRWAAVETPALLAAWTAAWWPDPASAPPAPAMFGEGLLADAAVQLLAGFDGARLVAGCAVTRSGGVAGLSCCFFPPGEAGSGRAELLAVAQHRHPGRPLVTYDQGEALQAWRGLGFAEVGPLRVWLGRR